VCAGVIQHWEECNGPLARDGREGVLVVIFSLFIFWNFWMASVVCGEGMVWGHHVLNCGRGRSFVGR